MHRQAGDEQRQVEAPPVVGDDARQRGQLVGRRAAAAPLHGGSPGGAAAARPDGRPPRGRGRRGRPRCRRRSRGRSSRCRSSSRRHVHEVRNRCGRSVTRRSTTTAAPSGATCRRAPNQRARISARSSAEGAVAAGPGLPAQPASPPGDRRGCASVRRDPQAARRPLPCRAGRLRWRDRRRRGSRRGRHTSRPPRGRLGRADRSG